MAIIGDQFDDCRSSKTEDNGKSEDGSDSTSEWPEICGCTISVRQSEDVVTVWNRVDRDVKLREQIRCVFFLQNDFFFFGGLVYLNASDTLRKVLNLPQSTIMEYKSNNGENSQQYIYTLAFVILTRGLLQTQCRTNRRLSGDQPLIKRHIPDVSPGEGFCMLEAMPDEAPNVLYFGIFLARLYGNCLPAQKS